MNEIQNKIKNNLSIFITFVNIILALGIFFQKDPLGLFSKTYTSSPKFINLEPKDIVRVAYARKENSSASKELIRIEGGWMVKSEENLQFTGDEEKINQLLKALLDSRKFTVAASGKGKFKEFGLDSEDTFVVELFQSGGTAGKFSIGNAASGGSFTHVSFNDSEDIYIVEDSLKSLFGRGADDFFINKRVPAKSFSSSDIQKLSWKPNQGKGYEFQIREGVWKDVENKAIDTKTLEPILNKVSSFFADSVLDEKNLGKLNTAKSGTLEFSLAEAGGGGTTTIEVLGIDTQDFLYGKLPGKMEIYKFPSYQWNPILEFSGK